ncbi:MAG TPA: alpha/beta hydrolase domain-containing protein, partial [Patescibacteria group bacterium]|nr:alpha/beta hydrolase domain-containing protein [Patescibacteria group bacterium]
PLATHTGWNLRHADIGGAEQLLVFAGATLPFAKTRHDRAASGDPRPAIAERYGSRENYLKRVRAVARTLVEDGYLLEEDVETSLTFAARMWEAWA